MKLAIAAIVIAVGVGIIFMKSANSLGVNVTDGEVLLATKDLDARFSRGESVSETYMIFGGTAVNHHNAVARVVVAGLPLAYAQRIHNRYPDFYRCSSPGANAAKRAVVQLSLVAANSDVLEGLTDSLDQFNANLKSGGDRICVRVQGEKVELKEVIVRENGEDVTRQMQKQDYLFVQSVETIEAKTLLAGE